MSKKEEKKQKIHEEISAASFLDHNEEKIHSIIWIVISLLIIKSTDMFNMLRTSEEINTRFIHAGMFFIGCFIIALMYLGIYLPFVKHVDQEWNEYCPNVIYAVTMCVTLMFISFMIGLWPVWGFLTPVILFVFVMTIMMSSKLIPNN